MPPGAVTSPVMPVVGVRAEPEFPAYEPGSRDDFDRLYRDSYPRIYRTMLAVLGDPAAAEDCTQDASCSPSEPGRDGARMLPQRHGCTGSRSTWPCRTSAKRSCDPSAPPYGGWADPHRVLTRPRWRWTAT